MKQIEFDEEQLSNLHEVAMALFADPEDPRSYAYRRELLRPKINWFAVTACCLLPLMCAAGLVILLLWLGVPSWIAWVAGVTGLVVYIVWNLKRAIICVVRIYQRYAPEAVRNKCRFEPSCSQYMILSLQKYGLIRGLRKGVDRLKRCNVDNGGFDMP